VAVNRLSDSVPLILFFRLGALIESSSALKRAFFMFLEVFKRHERAETTTTMKCGLVVIRFIALIGK